MKALVFHKPKDVRIDRVKDPVIEHPRDAILRVTATAICGSEGGLSETSLRDGAEANSTRSGESQHVCI